MPTLPNSIQELKTRLKKRKFFFGVKKLRGSIRQCLADLEQLWLENRVVTLRPAGEERGRALFSYRIEGFVLAPDDPLILKHTNYWQSVQMARTLTEMGYVVDVIDYRNSDFQPEKEYSLFVDVRKNMERLAPRLGNGCLKIFHIDTAQILAHNAAEANRLLALLQRRGTAFSPRLHQPPNRGIEVADYATGNVGDFSLSTFRYAGKPIYALPAPVAHVYDFPVEKNWSSCRRRFIWLGSNGLVHKGLDLVLDAFANMPDCHLTVCTSLDQDPEFKRAYHRELYEMPNIDTAGWMEMGSERFREIASSCAAVVYPSCSEGLSTSTIECMHAGMIPIVSHETGVPVGDFGCEIHPCTVEQIQQIVRNVAEMNPEELRGRSERAWEFARANHTREKFAARYRKVIEEILTLHKTGG